jgi:integrase
LFSANDGMIQVADGKSKAARRLLPMVPEVYNTLRLRWESQNRPAEGWVFPAGSVSGHLEESGAKIQHGDALKKLTAAKAAFDQWEKDGGNGQWQATVEAESKIGQDYIYKHSEVVRAGLKPFEPYCLRQTALSGLADAGCDVFTLARIAGHSSITITQRYYHPQANAIDRAFRKMLAGHKIGHKPELLIPVGSSGNDVSESS